MSGGPGAARPGAAPRWAARAATALVLAAAVAPFWAGRWLPLLDLPQHLGLATVVAHAGEAGNPLDRYYTVDAAVTPYWGYYGAMWLLARALPIEAANRVLLSAYAAAIPLAAAYLLASFGRDRRWAVLAAPVAFGTHLFFGFATFLLSIPVFLLALGLAERHLERPSPRTGVALAVTAAAVFLCHAQTYLLLGLCVLVLLAVRAPGPRALLARGAPFLPSLGLFAAWAWRAFVLGGGAPLRHTPHFSSYGRPGHLGAAWEPWRTVVTEAPRRLFGAFTDGSDGWLGLALAAAFAAALALAWGRAPVRDAGAPPGRLRGALLAHRCDLLAAALLASYLLAPMEISGQWYVNPRHLPFAALALPLLLARPVAGARAVVAAVALAIALATSANAAAKVRAFQAQVGDFDAVARALPPGGRVLGLPFDLGGAGPVRLWPFLHWACWQQVLARGDVGFSFAGLPSIPVRYRPGMQAPHPYEWRPDQLDWASMGAAYDAFLVSGAPRGRGGAELVRHAVPVVRSGPWSLWRAAGAAR